MKSVRYLKVVLTVIAACLVWICLRDVVPVGPGSASGDETMDVRIVGVSVRGPLSLDSTNVLSVRVVK